MLKEYIARGNYIYPPVPTMRLTTDLFAYCHERVPRWNTISISGYHFREKGCSAVQEVAFTLCSGIAYVQAAIEEGLDVDDFAPRLAFFFNGHNNVFQEVAKFRAARRMWAHIMRERFGAKNPKATMLRFHTQTGGVTLTAQQPENNIVRVALQGFAAVCGGTQSLHTNGFDEALALPTEHAAKIALRTQQILAHESGAADTVDPFAGSYFVESLTDEIEARANELIAKVDALGGSVNAIEFITGEIDESAWGYQERYRIGQDIVVGVNAYQEEDIEVPDLLRVDPESEREQLARLAAFKADRDHALVERRLEELREVARGSENLLPAIRQALKDRCSLGEVCGAMQRRVRHPTRRGSEPSARVAPMPHARPRHIPLRRRPRAAHHGRGASRSAGRSRCPIMFAVAGRHDPRSLPLLHRIEYTVERVLVNPALLALVAAGIFLASDGHHWSEFFVQWGLAAAIVIGGLVGSVMIPTAKRAEDASPSATSRPRATESSRRARSTGRSCGG